jgi:hypothetical protein
MNFFNRLQGIFFNPQMTVKSISERPIWLDAMIFLLIIIALMSYIVSPFSQKDTVQTLKNNVKLQESLGEEKFNELVESRENPSKLSVIILSFIIAPVSYLLGFLLSSLIVLGIGRLFSTEGKYLQVFAVLLHANFIDKLLGNAVRLILVFSKKSVIQTTTGLALFFPHLETTSTSFVILSQFDFFQLWLFGILGLGLAYVFKIELKKALVVSYGFWFIKSLFYISIHLLLTGIFG